MLDTITRRGYPIVNGFLIVFAIIELSISAWLIARYNTNHNYSSNGTRDRVRYILFASIWSTLIGAAYMAFFMIMPGSILSSIASHLIFYFVSWIIWLAAAAAITQTLGGALNCDTNVEFVYCGQLNALEGFAWLIWVWLTFILLFVLVRGIISARKGEGVRNALVES